jgi:hypothetical protein
MERSGLVVAVAVYFSEEETRGSMTGVVLSRKELWGSEG